MTITQSEYFVELSSFDDLARYACAFREYPRRVYSQEFDGSRIISTSLTLANTLLIFYAQMPKSGRYISYQVNAGKEICEIVESTKDISNYAPIVHMESKISSLSVKNKKIPDQFHPIQVKDLGSLARLTYDPEFCVSGMCMGMCGVWVCERSVCGVCMECVWCMAVRYMSVSECVVYCEWSVSCMV